MKDELGERIMVKFVELEAKTYSYFIDDCNENKKPKSREKVCHKKKVHFQNYKNCLEATQLENNTNNLEKTKIDICIFFCWKKNKEFLKKNKLILKSQ